LEHKNNEMMLPWHVSNPCFTNPPVLLLLLLMLLLFLLLLLLLLLLLGVQPPARA
jgi:hypothetical protein